MSGPAPRAPAPLPAAAPGADLSRFHDSLGFLLRLSQQRNFARFFATLGPLDLTPGAFTILLALRDNPGLRQGVLAKALMIKRANMAKIVRVLADRGLVARQVPEDDRRAVELILTAQGAAFVAAREAAFFRHDRESSPELTEQERKTLLGLLRKLAGREGDAP
ncbi:MarR family transcriptional regulator [Paroceanicella profunda]|uniref:MarR family transcriptional regulator n=1 Tax=Paroceanicella profunda TaxID=2579971 RepID=A0A5B8FWC0_9RHOB|nr:MarR family transcriptional regulator [Paroceanicella profunda]QDL92795.1 MarR family transcriptional regulator [Paroceanicella profunda]